MAYSNDFRAVCRGMKRLGFVIDTVKKKSGLEL